MILKVKNISKEFQKKVAVDNVSFEIKVGEAYGLLGPNGAGKSTAINMISGILETNSGESIVNNFSIKKNRKKAQKFLGVVPQEIALYPSMSAKANLEFFGKLYGLKGIYLDEIVEENLKLVGLYERRNEAIEKYSGGMKRRINIAAALLHRPKLLIMDEPTVGIDPQSRNYILETIKKLQKEKGMSILYTSHYMEEVEAICDRVGIIDNGKLIAEGTIQELKEKHGNTGQVVITVKNVNEVEEKIKGIEDLLNVKIKLNNNRIHIPADNPSELLPQVMNVFERLSIEIKAIEILEPNLETIFLTLTGRSLRDE